MQYQLCVKFSNCHINFNNVLSTMYVYICINFAKLKHFYVFTSVSPNILIVCSLRGITSVVLGCWGEWTHTVYIYFFDENSHHLSLIIYIKFKTKQHFLRAIQNVIL